MELTAAQASIILGLAGRHPYTVELAAHVRKDMGPVAEIIYGDRGLFAIGALTQAAPGTDPVPTLEAVAAAERYLGIA